jgi:predicted  nucleic acid-binding Zn-ribbon protein
MFSFLINSIKSEWKPFLILACGLLIVFVLSYIQTLRTENEKLSQENQTATATIHQLMVDVEYNRKALTQRQEETNRLAQEKSQLQADLEDIYATNKEACDWGNSTIPDSIYNKLCQ